MLLIIIVAIISAFICNGLARAKGRDTLLAAFAGIFFGVFAVAYYLFVPDMVKH